MPAAAGTTGSTGEQHEDRRRAELAAVSSELYDLGLLTPSGGNLSVLLPGGRGILITPSGLHKGRLRPQDMITVGRDGRPAGEGRAQPARPSVETPVHTAIYRVRPDVRAVVHGHPPHAIAVATCGLRLRPIALDVAAFAGTPVLPYMHPGSAELAAQVAGAMATHDVVLLAGHGAFAAGRSLQEAAARLSGLERACRLFLLIRQHAGPNRPK